MVIARRSEFTMVIAKQAGRVERVWLRLPAASVVSIKALPAAPLRLIELPEQMKPAGRSNSTDGR